jgi:hypothetical protein
LQSPINNKPPIAQPQSLSVVGREIIANQPANKLKTALELEQKPKQLHAYKQSDSEGPRESKLLKAKDDVHRVVSEHIPQSEPLMALIRD